MDLLLSLLPTEEGVDRAAPAPQHLMDHRVGGLLTHRVVGSRTGRPLQNLMYLKRKDGRAMNVGTMCVTTL